MKNTIRKLVSGLSLLGVFIFSYFYVQELAEASGEPKMVNEAKETTMAPDSPIILEVVLRRSYLDGEVSEETVKEEIWELENFWAKYENWQLVEMNESKLVFQLNIDDISPLLKANGFFGVSEDGTLSIYNGKPVDADVIQSFFQIDMKKLEGKKQQQLLEGIPVKTKEVFAQVLETMKFYSLEKDE